MGRFTFLSALFVLALAGGCTSNSAMDDSNPDRPTETPSEWFYTSELTDQDPFWFVEWGSLNALVAPNAIWASIERNNGLVMAGSGLPNGWNGEDCLINADSTLLICEIPAAAGEVRGSIASDNQNDCRPASHAEPGTCYWDARNAYGHPRTRQWLAAGLDLMANPDAEIPVINLCFRQVAGAIEPRTDNCNLASEPQS